VLLRSNASRRELENRGEASCSERKERLRPLWFKSDIRGGLKSAKTVINELFNDGVSESGSPFVGGARSGGPQANAPNQ